MMAPSALAISMAARPTLLLAPVITTNRTLPQFSLVNQRAVMYRIQMEAPSSRERCAGYSTISYSRRKFPEDPVRKSTFRHNSAFTMWFVSFDITAEGDLRSVFDLNDSLTQRDPRLRRRQEQSFSLHIREDERSNNSMSKVWLITGSSRGIGRKVAEAALAAGDRVVATARNPERLQELVDRYGDQIRTAQHDVTKASAAVTAVQTAMDAFQRIDVVVNGARSDEPTVEDFSVETFRVPMETNHFGFAYLIEAVLPVLRQQGTGHVIEIPPAASRFPSVGLSAYHMSKDAVEDFTAELAREVTPHGIKVTIVETGTRNPRHNHLEPSAPVVSAGDNKSVTDPAQRTHTHESQEPNDPENVARLILWIAGMAEPPLRLFVGFEASQHVTAGQALTALQAKWQN